MCSDCENVYMWVRTFIISVNKLVRLPTNWLRSILSLGCAKHSVPISLQNDVEAWTQRIWDFKLVGHGVVDLKINQSFEGLVVTAGFPYDLGLHISHIYINLSGTFVQAFLLLRRFHDCDD